MSEVRPFPDTPASLGPPTGRRPKGEGACDVYPTQSTTRPLLGRTVPVRKESQTSLRFVN